MTMQKIANLIVSFIESVENAYERRGALPGLSTSFTKLDILTGGLGPADLFVLASLPAMGKTAFALNIVDYVAVTLKKGVVIFSPAASAEQVVRRLMCSRARVDLDRVRDGFLKESHFPELTLASSKLVDSTIFIDDTAGISMHQVAARSRELREQHGIELIVIDPIHFLHSPHGPIHRNCPTALTALSVDLKSLARELHIPLIALARLTPKPEHTLASWGDLTDLDFLGLDADLVGLMRLEYTVEGDEARAEMRGIAKLLIASNRNGPVGEIDLMFHKEYGRFEG
jgi:replicative DNA helicase